MRVSVRVTPSSKAPGVGGRYGEGEPPVLLVRVRERAVDGAANEAVRQAVANAFGVPPRAVALRSGTTNRSKVLEVEGGRDERLVELLELAQG